VLIDEGLARLARFVPACQGVDVAALVRDVTNARDELMRLGPERMNEYDLSRAPKVRLTR